MAKKKTTQTRVYKKDTSRDYLGLAGVVFCLLLLFYLLVENYMGYMGIQKLFDKEADLSSRHNMRK